MVNTMSRVFYIHFDHWRLPTGCMAPKGRNYDKRFPSSA